MDERDTGQRGYEDWPKPAQDLLKRGVLALALEFEPNGMSLSQLTRRMAGEVKGSSHDRSVDCAVRDLIADGLLEKDNSGIIRATQPTRVFDQLGL